MTWANRPRLQFGQLAAIHEGAGRPVLLLHGVGLRAEAWNAQIDALKGQFSVTAPDMPGHGESSLFAHVPTLVDYSDRIAVALAEPAFVVGHSMGAMIALDLASRYPQRVLGVVALNAIFRRSPVAAQAVQSRAASLDGESIADPSATLRRWFGDAPSRESQACRRWLSDVSPAGYKAAYTVFAKADGPSEDALAALHSPSLFATGSDEPNSTPAMSLAMAALAENSQSLVIANAAHMMPMTHATDVNAALLGFFEGHGPKLTKP